MRSSQSAEISGLRTDEPMAKKKAKQQKPKKQQSPEVTAPAEGRDWAETLFLPKTDFPMRAGLPKMEPTLLERWSKIDLYNKLRAAGQGRDKFILHDGPPYANGNIHIGTGLNKILKAVSYTHLTLPTTSRV